MKLAFNGQAHYIDFLGGYALYKKRTKKDFVVSFELYKRVIRCYCKLLAERLLQNGMIDLPKNYGIITSAIITRKPQYRGKKFIGYGAKVWRTGQYDGKLKTFGMVYLPRHGKHNNMRCLGYVANRCLFKKMKAIYESDSCSWQPIEFNDDLI